MNRSEYRLKFKGCDHDWELDTDVEGCYGKAAGNGIFRCEKCGTCVTMIEKYALDGAIDQRKSLKIQETHTWNGMVANMISAFILLVSFFTLIFGDKILSYFQ